MQIWLLLSKRKEGGMRRKWREWDRKIKEESEGSPTPWRSYGINMNNRSSISKQLPQIRQARVLSLNTNADSWTKWPPRRDMRVPSTQESRCALRITWPRIRWVSQWKTLSVGMRVRPKSLHLHMLPRHFLQFKMEPENLKWRISHTHPQENLA